MNDQPIERPPTQPEYSADRRYFWNGFQWKPNPSFEIEQRARAESVRTADRSTTVMVLAIVGAVALFVLVPAALFLARLL